MLEHRGPVASALAGGVRARAGPADQADDRGHQTYFVRDDAVRPLLDDLGMDLRSPHARGGSRTPTIRSWQAMTRSRPPVERLTNRVSVL